MPKALIDSSAEAQDEPAAVALPPQGLAAPAGGSVPCMYCRGPIQSTSFVYSSAAKRLVSASCTTCGHGITVATVTWRRWVAADGATTQEIDLRE